MQTPGLSDKSIEAFAIGERVLVCTGGNVIDITESIDLLARFREILEQDTEALELLDRLHSDPVEQIVHFVRCRFGDLDKRADISEDGISIPEYWNCGSRGICPYEGIICKLPGNLTKREIDIVRYVANDLTDKEIADGLGIAYNTVHTHIRNIEQKINAASKCGIVSFAFKNNII